MILKQNKSTELIALKENDNVLYRPANDRMYTMERWAAKWDERDGTNKYMNVCFYTTPPPHNNECNLLYGIMKEAEEKEKRNKKTENKGNRRKSRKQKHKQHFTPRQKSEDIKKNVPYLQNAKTCLTV